MQIPGDDLEPDWPAPPKRGICAVPNVVITAANVLEVYVIRVRKAVMSVLEFDDSIHNLRLKLVRVLMHCFEGPDWLHLIRGRESFPKGPLVKVDPQGRCGGVLVYSLQLIILKASQLEMMMPSPLVGQFLLELNHLISSTYVISE
ncbi:unnamed protein product [Eruca vesicaria subsp. sativa]|uniref:Uncharacterized protein n=1 Tax=Eruca vesicaria subsp. sativa TaxID=29727 RepID=A0ABC8JWQ4_ERUVS|nr:unnamed protein product [Eruca vesicaria subsp. sativa]